MQMKFFLAVGCLLTGNLLAFPAHAEKGDRDKPVDIYSNSQTGNIGARTSVLTGDVRLIQGTFHLEADQANAREDIEGYYQVTAIGGKSGLAHFRQKRDGKAGYVEGEAERIEYDQRTTKLKLIGRATVHDEFKTIHGEYIEYDNYTTDYAVESSNSGSSTKNQSHSIFQPHPKAPGTDASQSAPATP